MTSSEFIIKYYPLAKEAESRSKIPAFFILAQAGLESAWGNKAPGFNFFGKKAFSNWTGKVQKLKTWECGKTGNPQTDGIKDEIIKIYPPGSPEGNASCNSKGLYSYRVYGKFKAYDTALEAFLDHSKFLQSNPRYRRAFDFLTSPEDFAREVARAGYATAPNYAEALVRTIGDVRKLYDLNRDKILFIPPLVPVPGVLPVIPSSIPSHVPDWLWWTLGGIGTVGLSYGIYRLIKKTS